MFLFLLKVNKKFKKTIIKILAREKNYLFLFSVHRQLEKKVGN